MSGEGRKRGNNDIKIQTGRKEGTTNARLVRQRHDEAGGPEGSKAERKEKKVSEAKAEKRRKEARKIERSLKQRQTEAGRQE